MNISDYILAVDNGYLSPEETRRFLLLEDEYGIWDRTKRLPEATITYYSTEYSWNGVSGSYQPYYVPLHETSSNVNLLPSNRTKCSWCRGITYSNGLECVHCGAPIY